MSLQRFVIYYWSRQKLDKQVKLDLKTSQSSLKSQLCIESFFWVIPLPVKHVLKTGIGILTVNL